MEELRKKVQQLQQRLELYEASERNQPHRASSDEMKNLQSKLSSTAQHRHREDEMNPFYRARSQAVHRVMKQVPIVMLIETMISCEIMTLR